MACGVGPDRAMLRLAGDLMGVRDGLARIVALPFVAALGDDMRATMEIVLAEALNNIVEHAYAGSTGPIEVTVDASDGKVCCILRDFGVRLPDERLPVGTLPGCTKDGQPEGGFGWHLIRSLSADLSYNRSDGCNCLAFSLSSDQP